MTIKKEGQKIIIRLSSADLFDAAMDYAAKQVGENSEKVQLTGRYDVVSVNMKGDNGELEYMEIVADGN